MPVAFVANSGVREIGEAWTEINGREFIEEARSSTEDEGGGVRLSSSKGKKKGLIIISYPRFQYQIYFCVVM